MPQHKWSFFRAGGVDQVALRSGADIAALAELDQKLWVALAMPTKGVDFDPKTLALLDGDKDGRVRVPDILAAVKWLQGTLKSLDDLIKGGDGLALSSLQEGPVLTGAKRILANLGKKDATSVVLADVADRAKIFGGTKLNGDGVIPADAADDDDTKAAVEQIIAALGSVPDRSGKPGVDQAKVDAFFDAAAKLVAWHDQPTQDKAILVAGDGTAAAADAVRAIKAKLDDFFARCRLAAFDARAAAALNGAEADFAALAAKELSSSSADVARLPLARVEPGRGLPLGPAVNPAWLDAVGALAAKAVTPLLGSRTTLSEAEWSQLQEKLAPYEAWRAARPGAPAAEVEKVGLERLRALVAGDVKKKLSDLIAADKALTEENEQIDNVEKVLLLKRDFFRLLTNFVSFSDFYSKRAAAFQAGTLYLDGRACHLTVPVTDAGKHGALAGMSATYLAYCDCTRPGGEKLAVAAAFTDGDADNLMVGRNGIFYDRKGVDWDATITKIVENPISIRAAFWQPYKKFVRLVEEQVAKRASAAEAEAQAKVAATAEATAHADKAAKPPEVKKVDVGTVAAIGVAIGGIGAMVVGILSAFLGLGAWMPLGILALVFLISGPSMLLAWLKLRQRNLGPILDANGWAVNTRARINVSFGAALTDLARLPPGTERSLDDPYADKKRPWKLYVALLVLLVLGVSWYIGKLDTFLPGPAKSTSVLGAAAPAAKPVVKAAEAQVAPAPAAPAAPPAP